MKIFFANTCVPYPCSSNGSACHGLPWWWAMCRDPMPRCVDAWKRREKRDPSFNCWCYCQLLCQPINNLPTKKPLKGDTVYTYACEVLSLGLLYAEFRNGIREGDGLRVLRCWCYFLFIFRTSNWTNYSIEVFHFLAQHQFYSHFDCHNRCYGHAVWIPIHYLARVYHVTSTWSIWIECWKEPSKDWVLTKLQMQSPGLADAYPNCQSLCNSMMNNMKCDQ